MFSMCQLIASAEHFSQALVTSWAVTQPLCAGSGTNMVANAWGAVIGAKVIKYRTAVVLGIACQIVGVVIFGPRSATIFNGILYDWTVLKPYPGLTLYALAWTEITLVIWQFLAIWKQILIPVYLGSGTYSDGRCCN